MISKIIINIQSIEFKHVASMILVIIESMQIKSSRLHISTSYSESNQLAEIISSFFYKGELARYT